MFAAQLRIEKPTSTQAQAEVLGAFASLEVGQRFELTATSDPRPILSVLQRVHPGGHEWHVLEAGPARFRVLVARRAPGPRTVAEYFEQDHRRIDAILPGVARALETGDLAAAGHAFAEFSCGLEQHIRAEEGVVFPAFERATGNSRGPTEVMRMEHVEIRDALRVIEGALAGGDAAASRSGLSTLAQVLAPHNAKEERVLYPMTDRACGQEASDDLVRRCQAVM